MSQRLFLPYCLSYSWKHHLQITNSIFNSRVCTKKCIILRKKSTSFWDANPGFWAHASTTSRTYQEQTEPPEACLPLQGGKQNSTIIFQSLPSAFVLLTTRGGGGKWSSQLSWRVSAAVRVKERCPEPNSTTETPLGATRTVLCQAGTSSAHTNRGENKGHNFSFDSAEGINTLFSRELSEAGCLCVSLNS